MNKRQESLPPRQTEFGSVWKMDKSAAIELAKNAGYDDDYIDTFELDYRALAMQAIKKISSQKD